VCVRKGEGETKTNERSHKKKREIKKRGET
jgi:hypothetical protein